jgi:hypothetical protein
MASPVPDTPNALLTRRDAAVALTAAATRWHAQRWRPARHVGAVRRTGDLVGDHCTGGATWSPGPRGNSAPRCARQARPTQRDPRKKCETRPSRLAPGGSDQFPEQEGSLAFPVCSGFHFIRQQFAQTCCARLTGSPKGRLDGAAAKPR